MKIQTLRNAALATCALAALPALGQAANIDAQADVCIKAFVSSLSGKYATAPKLRESHIIDAAGSTPADTYEFTMTATNPRDNKRVARAVCTVSAQGEVISMRDNSL
ncbi:MAG TPA: hypothetical protein VMI92_02745 [Steroidobacteraceae bacterium]|nr:hypothetical protein [Steroidobacteraceae bacterium]